jgi:hypothetical protein
MMFPISSANFRSGFYTTREAREGVTNHVSFVDALQ